MKLHWRRSLLLVALSVVGMVPAASAAIFDRANWTGFDTASTETATEEPAQSVPMDDFSWEDVTVRSRWSGRVGAVILQRAHLQSQPLITSLSGPQLLNANQFNFDFQGGPDVYLLRTGEVADVDFRYFGVNQWISPTRSVTDPVGVQFEFFNPSQTQVDTATTVRATYLTSLQSVEFNLRKNVRPRVSLLAGIRYLSLRDRADFNIALLNGTELIDASVGAANNLLGVQVGADGILWDNGRRLRLESAIKAGVYGNAAANTIRLQFIDGSGSLIDHRDHTAFVGDLNLTGVYQINNHFAFRAGYQLLWVAGVAVASDQFHVIDPSDNPSIHGVDTNGAAFYHGALVGLECAW